MMRYDLIVIGSGPAGQKAALTAAKAGKKVVVIERYHEVGGGCVHYGTIPSKALRESSYRFSLSSQGALGHEIEFGTCPIDKNLPDMSRLKKRYQRVVQDEARVVRDQLERNDVEIRFGEAKFLSANEIQLEGETIEILGADYIFVAVGANPVSPPSMPLDGKRVLDSNSILEMEKMPKSMIVLGAGVIGTEYASIFLMAGTDVTLVDRRKEVLSSVDREIVAQLVERLEHFGMRVILEQTTENIERTPDGVKLTLSGGEVLEAECVLVAQGRKGNTENLGLAELGVDINERSLISVDRHHRTTVPNIYAVGDVIGFPALASTSMEQGRIACCHAFDLHGDTAIHTGDIYPYGIYTIPEISMIGFTEEELKKRGDDFVIGRAKYNELARGQIVGDRWGLLKMLVSKDDLRVLGVHVVGDNAADLIHIAQAVMVLGGDVRYFVRQVFNYPTLAEAYKTAAFNAINHLHGANTAY